MLGILKGLGQKQGRSEQPSTFRRSLRRAAHSRRHRKAGAGSECDKRIETEFADVAAQPIIQLVGLAYCVVVLIINTVVDGLYLTLNPKLRLR